MISIHKGIEPRLLREYKHAPDAQWDGPAMPNGITFTDVKDELRRALFREQHGLCAYCMSAIDTEHCKIEHFLPRTHHPERCLEYKNLLLCCPGIYGDEHTCDTKKDASPLSPSCNPAGEHPIERFITYDLDDGSILWQGAHHTELDDTLNLNSEHLKNNRLIALRNFKKIFITHSAKRNRKTEAEKAIRRFTETTGDFLPYLGIILYWLRSRLCHA